MLKKCALCVALAFVGMSVTGCAQLTESLAGAGQETPKNAPPGYHTFTKAQQSEKENNFEVELGRGRGISNLDKKARITRPAPLI